MSIVHIPFYPSDWLAGTRGLTAEETGVYITLISRMYEMAGPIERDDDRLSRLCGCKTRSAFKKCLDYLISEGKVIVVDGELFNERVEKEIQNTTEKSDKARQAAQSRWDRKTNKNNQGPNAGASAEHMPQQCQSKPKPKPESKNNNPPIYPPAPEFEEIWKHYPRKVGKGAAEKAWNKAIKAHDPQAILPALGNYCRAMRGTDQQFIPNLATWLNQKRWEDDQSHATNRPRTSRDDLEHLSRVQSSQDDITRLMAHQLKVIGQ